jgi:choline-sulfatase/uncharacterized sulfatase
VDHGVGELLAWLEASQLQDNTIVIYSSDHGDYACEHGIMEKAPGICSDAITRIPMLWRWPGHFKPGHAVMEIVETVDLANTLCALAKIDFMETSDGQNIAHLLHGESGEVHSLGVTEFAWSKSVRQGRYRLVFYPREMFADEYPEGFGELYDLVEDPWEMHNLYFMPQYAGIIQQLQQALMDWLVSTTRPATIWPAVERLSSQSTIHYGSSVNPDYKIHPDRIREAKTKNYI